MRALVRPALVLFALLSLLTGVVYPLMVTAIAQLAWPDAANGSPLVVAGTVRGSRLLGQDFTTDPRWFWGRPSATAPRPYTAFDAEHGTGSSGSNLAPTNPDLLRAVQQRLAALRAADAAALVVRAADDRVPVDLVTASASGLDPHISPAAALWQCERVARVRGVDVATLRALVAAHTEAPQCGVFGDARVSVLELNIALETQ